MERLKERITKNKELLLCFLINLLLGLLVFVPYMLAEQGIFSLGTDYDNDFIPLNEMARNGILNGEVFWNWQFDLGTDFIGAGSFIALGSPFFWITLLFPNVKYMYLGGWIFALKYAVAGLTAGLYLRRFLTKKSAVISGSILYAFSGFQAVNLMFGFFHDVAAFFPLMLWGMEVLLQDGKKGIFAITVGLNAIVNYYFFVQEVIFCIFYFLLRFVWENRQYWKKVPACILEGLWGTAIAGGYCFRRLPLSCRIQGAGHFWICGPGCGLTAVPFCI